MKTLEQRFWEKVDKKSNKECWNWIVATRNGYGVIRINNKNHKANRISWELNKGYISNNLYVLHKCDNKLCVNPKHLFLGTQKDNMQDKVTKNRQARHLGELNGRSKLTKKDILKIRKNFNISRIKLAKKFNVSRQAIDSIINKKTWTHI